MSLSSLPTEIVLKILSYLPVSSLADLCHVSRAWNNLFLHHEAAIYRQAAFLHGIIQDDSSSLNSLQLSQKYSQRILRNVDSWKALCRIRICVRNAWNGVAPSQTIPKPRAIGSSIRESVHRIKVDEQRKLIISTTGMDFPRVEVRDMETGRGLWFLEPSMGRMYAHLEYSNGFFIFDRSNGDREVWRLSGSGSQETTELPPDFDSRAQPEAFMLEDSKRALRKALGHYLGRLDDFRPRGCFEPYAVLRSPEETRAYRFVYPTLMTAAHEKIYLWDVPSARIVEVVSGLQKARITNFANREKVPGSSSVGDGSVTGGVVDQSAGNWIQDRTEDEIEDGDDLLDMDTEEEDTEDEYSATVDEYLLKSINYVDHCSTHIFLAGKHVLKVFTRTTNYMTEDTTQSSRLAIAITSTKLRYGRWKYTINPGSRRPKPDSALVPYKVEVSTMDLSPPGRLYDRFKAVHVSPCGSHLVALLDGVRLLVLPHFKDLVGQPEDVVYDHTLDVQLGSPAVSKSVYLAYGEGDGGEGRVGVVTSTAVFVITLPSFPPDYFVKAPPLLHISRVKELMDPNKLSGVSCLMMSDSRMFLNYDPSWATIDIETRTKLLQEWEQKFEETLAYFQENELECYGRKDAGFLVWDLPDRNDFRPYSTIYEIDMLPSCQMS